MVFEWYGVADIQLFYVELQNVLLSDTILNMVYCTISDTTFPAPLSFIKKYKFKTKFINDIALPAIPVDADNKRIPFVVTDSATLAKKFKVNTVRCCRFAVV